MSVELTEIQKKILEFLIDQKVNKGFPPTLAEIAPIVDGKPDITKISEIDLQKLGEKYRYQKIIFTGKKY